MGNRWLDTARKGVAGRRRPNFGIRRRSRHERSIAPSSGRVGHLLPGHRSVSWGRLSVAGHYSTQARHSHRRCVTTAGTFIVTLSRGLSRGARDLLGRRASWEWRRLQVYEILRRPETSRFGMPGTTSGLLRMTAMTGFVRGAQFAARVARGRQRRRRRPGDCCIQTSKGPEESGPLLRRPSRRHSSSCAWSSMSCPSMNRPAATTSVVTKA